MKLFSPEKANALIPVVTPLLDDLWKRRRDLAIDLLASNPAATQARPTRAFADRKAEIVRLIARIEAYGCVVKDIDLGLLDFPAFREGRPVFLCWKAGEPAIGHWHASDETFVDRKRL